MNSLSCSTESSFPASYVEGQCTGVEVGMCQQSPLGCLFTSPSPPSRPTAHSLGAREACRLLRYRKQQEWNPTTKSVASCWPRDGSSDVQDTPGDIVLHVTGLSCLLFQERLSKVLEWHPELKSQKTSKELLL